MDDSMLTFMDNLWLQVEDNIITVGINEEGLADLDTIVSVDLPEEDEAVVADEICGQLDSRDGPLNVYSPVDGSVIELNAAVIDSPEIVRDDPYGEGWLMRIEADNPEDIDALFNQDSLHDDEEEVDPDE